MLEEMLATWRTHAAIDRFMLDNITDDGLLAIPLLKGGAPGRGRNVARVFAHLVEVRLSHMRLADKAAMAGVPDFEKGATPSREHLHTALAASSVAVEALMTRLVTKGELLHGRGPLHVLGYFISHESHHRGQLMLALKQNAVSISDELRWGLWSMWFKD
jgi:uncharacterized damage-inducible protein DinB